MNRYLVFVLVAALATACAEAPTDSVEVEDGDYTKVQIGKADASAEALFLDFEFDGQVLVSSTWNLKRNIEDQLLYTVGQLNGDRSVSRLDKIELTNVEQVGTENGLTREIGRAHV